MPTPPSPPLPDMDPSDPAVMARLALIAGDGATALAYLGAVLDELTRLRTFTDPDMTIRDLALKVRDGHFNLSAVTGPKGGTPAMRFLAAIMLAAILGDDGVEPPNYQSTEIEMDVKPGSTFQHFRAYLEVIKPGGRSSHQIREALEKKLRDLGVDPDEV